MAFFPAAWYPLGDKMYSTSFTHGTCAPTTIKYDGDDLRLQEVQCQHCNRTFPLQIQRCEKCLALTLVMDLSSFEKGKYACQSCHVVQPVRFWQPPRKQKKSLITRFLSKLFSKKKGTLIHCGDYKCPSCQAESIFLDIEPTGTIAICADCSKEFKISLVS